MQPDGQLTYDFDFSTLKMTLLTLFKSEKKHLLTKWTFLRATLPFLACTKDTLSSLLKTINDILVNFCRGKM